MPPCCTDRPVGVGSWAGEDDGPFPEAWTPAVPFKAKAACRRHIPKQQHRVINWAAYDAGLRARSIFPIENADILKRHRQLVRLWSRQYAEPQLGALTAMPKWPRR